MKYVSPKVFAVYAAIVKIQGLGKVIGAPPESVVHHQGTRFPRMKQMNECRDPT